MTQRETELADALRQTLDSLLTALKQAYRATPGEQYINDHPSVIAAREVLSKV